jgi:cobalt-zinc-cadmium efflux system membrane fusion protein
MSKESQLPSSTNRFSVILVACLLAAALGLSLTSCSSGGDKSDGKAKVESKEEKPKDEHSGAREVELSEETLKAAKIETAEAIEQNAGETLRVTGSVETNQQQTQQVTPLVSGRVERVNVALGDRVGKGAALAVVSSPEVAEMHGKLHEAETRLALAEKNLARVRQPESRVALLQAKAKLDEAEAGLRRTQKLIELGAGAGKDLTAAEAAYKSAKAEYEYQNNISLNREVQQAQAEVETARVEVSHLRNSLRALGADLSAGENATTRHDTSLVVLRAPASGAVTERLVNAGAGIEAGKPIFTVANISNLWVIANVPEAQVRRLRVGTAAQVRAAGGEEVISARITYIDPSLTEATRTARVRVEMANPGERFKVGSFVEVSFKTATSGGVASEPSLVIPDEAVQRIGERTVVFVPKEKDAGHFEAREVELGGVSDGMRRVTGGLKAGERVVTKGSFVLKTQLMKGELGEEH